MATVVSTYTNEAGHEIAVYESGAERDVTIGRMIKPAPHALITSENSHEFRRKRKEKQARLLREAIASETADALELPRSGSAAAVAAAGGILWREIVLSPDAYPRDRMEAWEKLGRHAEILSDPREKQADDGGQAALQAAAMNGATALLLERVWADVMKAKRDGDVIDGTIAEERKTE